MGTIFYRLVLTGQVDSNGRNGRDGECAERDNMLSVNGLRWRNDEVDNFV